MIRNLRVSSRTGMWGVGHIWLTCSDPSPYQADYSELSKEIISLIEVAIHDGRIFDVSSDEPTAQPRNIVAPVQAPVVVVVPEDSISADPYYGLSPVVHDQVRQLLKKTVAKIKVEGNSFILSKILSAAIAMEQDSKNRKTVVSFFDKKLSKSIDLSEGLTAGVTMYDNMVTEEDVETYKFKVENLKVNEEDLSEDEQEDLQNKIDDKNSSKPIRPS
jgi:hypothetical protein